MSIEILITVLSWEERFYLGLQKNLEKFEPRKVLLFKYNNPLTKNWKEENLKQTRKLLGNKLEEIDISVSAPKDNWLIFKNTFSRFKQKNILLDITTMTRESIWLSLYNCRLNKCVTDYVYYKPKEYSGDWLSRDPGKPRLLYKMSGIAQLGSPTLLLVTCGFDIERLDSLIYNFEPKTTLVMFLNNEEERNRANLSKCTAFLKEKYNIDKTYTYDGYNINASLTFILERLQSFEENSDLSYLDSYNIILNSLGPKPSAITLFNVWLKYPQVALSYIPSNEYNKEYSLGIGDSFTGNILS